jgi:hypothetical protein
LLTISGFAVRQEGSNNGGSRFHFAADAGHKDVAQLPSQQGDHE